MADAVRGRALVAQSGGPKAVINSSACGVIQEAQRHRAITGIYGAIHGMLGLLLEDLFDLQAESPAVIAGLRSTPAAAIGSCRFKLGSLDRDRASFERVLAVLRAHAIRRLGVKCRYNKLGTCQRNAIHFASQTDSDEAYRWGQEAVRAAVQGGSGMMMTLVRESQEPYQCEIGQVRLSAVANTVRKLPREFMKAAGNQMAPAMRDDALPLIRGEVALQLGAEGLPVFVRFRREPVPRQLPAFKVG
jgi:6-phosphofructokinase